LWSKIKAGGANFKHVFLFTRHDLIRKQLLAQAPNLFKFIFNLNEL
jgi:hypothetical protein